MNPEPQPSPLARIAAPAGIATAEKLRVLFITEDDPLYVINFFDVFFAEFPRDEFEIIGITVDKAFHESKVATARRIHRFYGTIDFARLLARFAAIKLSGRSIARLATTHGIRIVPCTSVNSPEYLQLARQLSPDVIVSVAAPEIFRKGILGVPRLGCINIHSGKLPRYRGMMPNFWQMLEGEKFNTVTVHEMAEKLDAGAVLGELQFPVRDRDSLDRVIVGTKREGARLMIEVLRQVAAGEAKPVPLDMTQSRYYKFPTPPDVARFRERGHRML